MDNVIFNMQLDANRLGYTISEYIPIDNEVEQFGETSRLIAVVDGVFNNGNSIDYHFYMQHNDGTWSHKPGNGFVTNKSLGSDVVLTNMNICAKANEGKYSNGELHFFIITKDAVIDYAHGPAPEDFEHSDGRTQIDLYYKDLAGELPQTSTNIGIGTTEGRIDFLKDDDVFCFTPTTTREYTFSTLGTLYSDLNCRIYDSSGNLIGTYDDVGEVYINQWLLSGVKYYFDIYNNNMVIAEFGEDNGSIVDYSISIS